MISITRSMLNRDFIIYFRRQIPSNPNLTRNRIPNERELGSLRELALQKKEAIDDLFEKAASARTKHEAVKNEYKSQLFILEEIESNLHLTKQNAESFEKAAETLGGEMLHLHGLLHPIRRSTDDNLRMIFESVVSGSGEPFLTASKLSHVCQRWRNVAISSPRLWSDLILKASFAYCTPNSKARTFLSRVKNAAATLAIRIHVNDAFTVQHLIRSIEQWPLFQLSLRSNISIWEIMVSSPSAENCSPLLHTITRFTSSTLDCLKLSILAPIDEPSNMFISKFPQFHKLELTCLHLGPTNPPCLIPGFSNLVEAVFHGIEDLSILGIIGTMPKLQTLRIQRCSVSTEPHLHDLVLFHLEILDFSPLNQQDYFPWRQIKCPKLTQLEFRVRDENLPADICSFVSVTTSITDMTIVYASPEDFLSLARIAPQLRRLCTWSDVEIAVLARWQQFGLNDPPFPNLLHLELRTWCYDSSFADVLDDIIRTRCLPRAHLTVATDGTVVHVLEAFSIIMWDTGEGASASYLALLAKHFSAYEEGGETIHRFVGEAGRESA